MNISWWCTTITEPWSWTFRAYPGIWLVVGLLVFGYFWALRRYRDVDDLSKRRVAFFLAGAVVFWLASDWPLGTLGAGYLASAHMVQYILYVLVAAPLLWLGTPEWMARRRSAVFSVRLLCNGCDLASLWTCPVGSDRWFPGRVPRSVVSGPHALPVLHNGDCHDHPG